MDGGRIIRACLHGLMLPLPSAIVLEPTYRIHNHTGPDRLGDHSKSSELALQPADSTDHICAGDHTAGWPEDTVGC